MPPLRIFFRLPLPGPSWVIKSARHPSQSPDDLEANDTEPSPQVDSPPGPPMPPGFALPKINDLPRGLICDGMELEEARLAKRLKRSTEYSQDYWHQLSRIHDLRAQIKGYDLAYERLDHRQKGGSDEFFYTLGPTLKLVEAIDAHMRQKRLFEEHDQKLQSSSRFQRVSASMFTCSRIGLDKGEAGNGAQKRLEQHAFKNAILKDYNLEPNAHSKENRGLYWDVATGTWESKDLMKASHIFPASWGQKMMSEMFGEECSDELFSSRNGLLLPHPIKRAMEEWAIVIVPDLPDDPTGQQVQSWSMTEPREYKFRVLDPKHPKLDERVSSRLGGHRLVRDFDQSRLVFRNDFRPRAGYLWLWFICACLKRFWQTPLHAAPDQATLPPQFGKDIWATAGPYLRRDFILGLIEEVGNENANVVLTGAKPSQEAEDQVPNKALLALVANKILDNYEKQEDDDDCFGDDEDPLDEEADGISCDSSLLSD